jgi:hypothetical protein
MGKKASAESNGERKKVNWDDTPVAVLLRTSTKVVHTCSDKNAALEFIQKDLSPKKQERAYIAEFKKVNVQTKVSL